LHAVDLSTGSDALPPVELAATYPGTGPESSNGVITFHPFMTWVRAGLVLWKKTIYVFFGSHCDNETFINNVNNSVYANGYSGFIMAYDEGTLKQVAVSNLNPSGGPPDGDLKLGSGCTIWNAGCAPAVDASGNIYAPTGNGPFNPSAGDYGDSCVKLTIDRTNQRINVVDYFTPYDQAAMAAADEDYGSGAAMVVPGQMDTQGVKHYYITANGKDGNLYLLDVNNLGKYNAGGSDNSNALEEIVGGLRGGVWSSGPYFHGALYFGPAGHALCRYCFDANAHLKSLPASKSAINFGYPGTSPTVSAFGTNNGIIWALERTSTVAVLHAYNANDLTIELWNSAQNAARDGLDTAVKFVVPTVCNGEVFIGTAGGVTEFGLLNRTAATDVTTLMNVVASGFTLLSNGHYQQTLTLTNSGTTALTSPFSVVVDNLPPTMMLANRNGSTSAVTPAASPYVNVVLSAPLAPGQSVSTPLEISDPTKAPITYNLRVLAGSGSR
jgi:hypothetical protein